MKIGAKMKVYTENIDANTNTISTNKDKMRGIEEHLEKTEKKKMELELNIKTNLAVAESLVRRMR